MLTQLFYRIRLSVFYCLLSIGQSLGNTLCNITPRWRKAHAHPHLNPNKRGPGECLCSDVSHKAQLFNVSLPVGVVNLFFSFLSFVGHQFPFKRSKCLTVGSTQYRNSGTNTHKPPAVPGLSCNTGCVSTETAGCHPSPWCFSNSHPLDTAESADRDDRERILCMCVCVCAAKGQLNIPVNWPASATQRPGPANFYLCRFFFLCPNNKEDLRSKVFSYKELSFKAYTLKWHRLHTRGH